VIFVVPVGELESWFPELNAGHGEPFVTAALEAGKLNNLSDELRAFVSRICKYFGVDAGQA
jgi:hypothetical protein